MQLELSDLTIEILESVDWDQEVAQAPKGTNWEYMEIFQKRREECRQQGDQPRATAFDLLMGTMTLSLTPTDRNNALRPMSQYTMSLDDISEHETILLRELIPGVADGEITSRLADVVWHTARHYPTALIAIDAYIDAATALMNEASWMYAVDRLHRALRLATMLQNGAAEQRKRVVSKIETSVANYTQIEDHFNLPVRLMEILLEFGDGDATRYAQLAGDIAKRTEESGDLPGAVTVYELQSRWYSREGDEESSRACGLKAAELHIEIGDQLLEAEDPNYCAVASHYQDAMEMMRRLGESERAQAVHARLLASQAAATRNMVEVSESMDISNFVAEAIANVRGRPLLDALLRLAYGTRPPTVVDLEETVKQRFESAPLVGGLIQHNIVNEQGRTVGRLVSLKSDDPEEAAKALELHMYSVARESRSIRVAATINPSRLQVMLEHRPTWDFMLRITDFNPFVRPGHARLVATGLLAGLEGDFIAAAHILIPQFENSFRLILEQLGVITSTYRPDGIQDEYNLNRILIEHGSKLAEVLDEDTVFDLRGLLIERTGSNLRNRLAHGLMRSDEFFGDEVAYAWWAMFRIVMLPVVSIHANSDAANSQPSTPGNDSNSQ